MSIAIPPSLATGTNDPTGTLVLRRKFSAQMTNRFREIKGFVNSYIIEMDSLRDQTIFVAQEEYSDISAKISAFMDNLYSKESDTVLEESSSFRGLLGWTSLFVFAAYRRGMSDSIRRMSRFLPRGAPAQQFDFGELFATERLRLLDELTFARLKGITDAMNTQILEVVTNGMLNGLNPRRIASLINSRVDKIGLTRARRLARTTIARIFNEGAIEGYLKHEQLLDKTILALYRTANDTLVRQRHIPRHEKLYTLEIVRTLLGEPDCRCSFSPFVVQPGDVIPKERFGPINPL